MYLKKLELNGFKSFADKTELAILPGITAIVGPNGCGKTNIVDAISWVLGEQRARLLRGYKMEDVIFNGTAVRPAVGMAEVSLLFDNADNKLPIEFAEVKITRRVFRSGEGEYLINNQPCRLRDINDLLLGTGLGTRSYALVEQGRIDQILRAPPEERRSLLEEAAGISRYRAKREEALRKLESTQNNLLRIEDIVKEVKRQLQVAERQAKHAELYRQCRDRLREMDIRLGRLQVLEIRKQVVAAEAQKQEWQYRLHDLEKEVRVLEDELSARRTETREKEEALGRLRADLVGRQAEIEKSRHRMEVNLERLRELVELDERLARETAEWTRRREEGEAEQVSLHASWEELKARNRETASRWEEGDRLLQDLRRQYAAAEKALNAIRERSLEFSRDSSRAKNELLTLQVGGKEMVLRQRKLTVELEKLAAEESELQNELGSLTAAGSSAAADLQAARVKAEEKRQEIQRLEALVGQIAPQEESLLIALKEKEARKEVLAGFGRERTDAAAGVLAAHRSGEAPLPGLVGVLSEFIRVDPGYEEIVSTLLGETARALVVESWTTAVALLKRARETKAGPFRMIVLEALPSQPSGLPPPYIAPGSVRQHVSFRPPLAGREELFIQKALVWEDAGHLPPVPAADVVLVSRQGEVLIPPGIIQWPGAGGDTLTGELKDLGEEVEQLRQQLAEAKGRREDISAALESARAEMETAGRELHQTEMRGALQQNEIERWGKSLERASLTRQSVAAELASLREEEANLFDRRREYEVRVAESSGQEQELETEFKRAQQMVDELAPRLRDLETEVTDLKISLASSREKEDAAAVRVRRLASELSAQQMLLESRQLQKEEGISRRRALEEENGEISRRAEELSREVAELDGRIRAEVEVVKAYRLACEDKERAYHDLRPRFQEFQSRVSSHDLHLAEWHLKEEGVIQRIREKYALELDAQELPAEEMSEEQLSLEIEKLRKKMEGMTDINLAALQEKESYEQRFRLLTEQKTDLENARGHIEEAIKKINVTARERLQQAYEQVRENFRSLFSQLFDGGKADLILDNESNILESGLDIVAQPPGKKLSHISLLSGGEKAMTTIALIFSLFQVQPSPFYLLDEIDAPLDEANIARFGILVKNLVRESQFMVITHNKRTIKEADILYGITMEESGVSKVVSVKLAHHRPAPESPIADSEPSASIAVESPPEGDIHSPSIPESESIPG